ncbi:4654_t:CDS:1, partial [Dentiscutata heterogama]
MEGRSKHILIPMKVTEIMKSKKEKVKKAEVINRDSEQASLFTDP